MEQTPSRAYDAARVSLVWRDSGGTSAGAVPAAQAFAEQSWERRTTPVVQSDYGGAAGRGYGCSMW